MIGFWSRDCWDRWLANDRSHGQECWWRLHSKGRNPPLLFDIAWNDKSGPAIRSCCRAADPAADKDRGWSGTHGPCEVLRELVETGGERYLELVRGSGRLKPCTRSLGGNLSSYILPLEVEPWMIEVRCSSSNGVVNNGQKAWRRWRTRPSCHLAQTGRNRIRRSVGAAALLESFHVARGPLVCRMQLNSRTPSSLRSSIPSV
jgi:hypothetical protein